MHKTMTVLPAGYSMVRLPPDARLCQFTIYVSARSVAMAPNEDDEDPVEFDEDDDFENVWGYTDGQG